MSTTQAQIGARLIPDKVVAEYYGIHRRTVHLWEKQGRIPKAHTRRENFTRWLESDILKHIADMRDAAAQEAST